MNLLAIILVFLAIVICVAISWIAWELSSDEPQSGRAERDRAREDAPKR